MVINVSPGRLPKLTWQQTVFLFSWKNTGKKAHPMKEFSSLLFLRLELPQEEACPPLSSLLTHEPWKQYEIYNKAKTIFTCQGSFLIFSFDILLRTVIVDFFNLLPVEGILRCCHLCFVSGGRHQSLVAALPQLKRNKSRCSPSSRIFDPLFWPQVQTHKTVSLVERNNRKRNSSVWGWEKSRDHGDGCTTTGVCSMPLDWMRRESYNGRFCHMFI